VSVEHYIRDEHEGIEIGEDFGAESFPKVAGVIDVNGFNRKTDLAPGL
jgi:hypothetical protein